MSRIPIALATGLVPPLQWPSPILGQVSSTISSARVEPNLSVMLLVEHRSNRRRHLLTTEHTGQLTSARLALHDDPRPATAAPPPLLVPHLTFHTTVALLALSNRPTSHPLELLQAARDLEPAHRELALQIITGGFTGPADDLLAAVHAVTA